MDERRDVVEESVARAVVWKAVGFMKDVLSACEARATLKSLVYVLSDQDWNDDERMWYGCVRGKGFVDECGAKIAAMKASGYVMWRYPRRASATRECPQACCLK